LPIKAGADILTFTGWSSTIEEAAKLLIEAVRNGEIDENTIDESVLKIIKLKQAYYNNE
jgi:beta-glucosidase-like glycosyl hydrolase